MLVTNHKYSKLELLKRELMFLEARIKNYTVNFDTSRYDLRRKIKP
jgi:hypothetical protein